MSGSEFFLYHEGQQAGPWTMDQVLEKLRRQEVHWADYVYSEAYQEWLPLMDAPHFAIKYREIENELNEQRQRESTAVEHKTDKDAWFVLRGDQRYGPYSKFEMMGLLLESKIHEYDLVWNSAQVSWVKVADLPQFAREKIQENYPEKNLSKGFLRRRHARASYQASILIHNNKAVYKGHSLEIGPGGASIILKDEVFKVGDECFLHFKAGDSVPTFNCNCRIVSVTKLESSEFRIGVQYTSISQTVQKIIKTYTAKVAA